jgi:hypothetical protein
MDNSTSCPDLICVIVKLAPAGTGAKDQFFVLPWRGLAHIIIEGHAAFLQKHRGVRPRTPESFHTAIVPEALARWEGQWQVLTKRVRPTTVSEGAATQRLLPLSQRSE